MRLIVCDTYREQERGVCVPNNKKCVVRRILLRLEKLMAACDCGKSTAKCKFEGKKNKKNKKEKLDGERRVELCMSRPSHLKFYSV